MTSQPQALLFDLGGVIIDIDFQRAIDVWRRASPLPAEDIQRLFKFDAAYERHERGEIEAADYYAHLASLLRIEGGQEIVAEGWNAIFIGEIAQTLALVRQLRPRVPCHVFSNTNRAHADTWRGQFPDAVAAFDGIFSSHEIGLRKPDREAFEHVARAMGAAPQDILFFDDRLDNVEGARAAGLQSVLVSSPRDVREAISACGLLDG